MYYRLRLPGPMAAAMQCPVMDWKYRPLGDSFSAFKERMTLYLADVGINDKEKMARKIQIALRDEGIRRITNSGLSNDDRKDPDKIYALFTSQLDASVIINFRVHRLEFAQLGQRGDENTCDYVSRLREKAKHWKFSDGELTERIIEQVVLTTPLEDLRKQLLAKDDGLTVDNR